MRKTMEVVQWYYAQQGHRCGPVSPEQLKQLAVSGQLQPSDSVWREGMAQWAAASQVRGLFPAATHPSPGLPPSAPAVPGPSDIKQPASATASVSAAQPLSPLPAAATTICEWCGESIPQQALKCPRCMKWRTDIAHDRQKIMLGYMSSLFFFMVAVFLFFAGMAKGWWLEHPPAFRFLQQPSLSEMVQMSSLEKFLTSGTGWATIGSTIAALVCLGFSIATRGNPRRKARSGDNMM
jgi:hypothetical protein